MPFEATIPIKYFENNPEYNPHALAVADGLYSGKEKFDAIKNELLRYRDIELSVHPLATKMRNARLSVVQNENLLPGYIDYLTASTNLQPLAIKAKGPSEKTKYWYALGDRIGSLGRQTLTHANVFGRAFVYISFPRTETKTNTLDDQKKIGSLDATLQLVRADQVQSWRVGDDGFLDYARIFSTEYDRSPTKPTSRARHVWLVVTRDEIAEFEVIKLRGTDGKIPDLDPKTDIATRCWQQTHTLGGCPLVPLIPQVAAMDRLQPLAIQHLNAVVRLEYGHDSSNYQQGYISADDKIGDIMISETTFLKFKQGGSLNFAGPDTAHLAESRADIERLAKAMPASLQIGALNVTNQQGNTSRMAAAARVHEWGSVAALLASHADDELRTYRQIIKLIQKGRQDEAIELELVGLDRFHIADDMDSIEYVEKLLGLMNGKSPTAAKHLTSTLIQTACSAASPETRQTIDEELEAAEFTVENNSENDAKEKIEKSQKETLSEDSELKDEE